MKNIKTRPKTGVIRVRDAAALAPKEQSRAIKKTAKARLLREHADHGVKSNPTSNFGQKYQS